MKIIVGTNLSHHVYSVGAFDCYMGYIQGFRQLGHDVYILDEVDPSRCFNEKYEQVKFEDWEGRHQFEHLAKQYGVWTKSCMIYNYGESTHGMQYDKVQDLARTADVLFNISGRITNPDILERVHCKAYIDEAPGKTQVYYSEYGVDRNLKLHDFFFTVGLNIGTERCVIPDCNVVWHGIFHPVDLTAWQRVYDASCQRFTTISNWEGKHTFNYQNRYSGDKAQNWRNFVSIPSHANQIMEVALNIDGAYVDDINLFLDNGWMLTDPKKLRTLSDLKQYVATSRAEFSVTNQRCVEFNIGWTGDRTARYLAAGKPAVIQDNGIGFHLPLGSGLLTFNTLSDAMNCIEAVNADYPGHCEAARQIAEQFFEAKIVAQKMLEHIGY